MFQHPLAALITDTGARGFLKQVFSTLWFSPACKYRELHLLNWICCNGFNHDCTPGEREDVEVNGVAGVSGLSLYLI